MTSEHYMILGYVVALGIPTVYALRVWAGLRRSRQQLENRRKV